MQHWTINVLGVVTGSVLLGTALLRLETVATLLVPGADQTDTVASPDMPPVRPAVVHAVATASLPAIVYPHSQSAGRATDPHVVPVPLPNVVGPTPAPGSVVAGTGFFIAPDGSLLTASHVVRDCQHIRIVSAAIAMTEVARLAEDRTVDVALLRGTHIRPPAVLSLAPGRSASPRLFILGFPATADLRVPNETWASLENARMPVDVRQTVWVRSSAVTHGYSGGPMLDPRSGAVAGIVKAGVEPSLLPVVRGGPATGLSFGPGSAPLTTFLRHAAPELDLSSPSATGDDALAEARRATVHVLCWRGAS